MSTQILDLWRAAQAQFARQDWPSAKRSLMAILAVAPNHAPALLNLSYVESYLGHYRAARDFALRAHTLYPQDPQLVMDLIGRLRTFNEAGAILDCLAHLPSSGELPIPVLLTIAAQLSYLNEQERSLPFLDEAYRGDPDYPPTLHARAQVLIYLGRFKEAKADLDHCLKRAPNLPSIYWHLSRMGKKTPGDNHVDILRRLLAAPAREPEHVALAAYALHNELDDLGDYAGAWEALDMACRSKRALLGYSMTGTHDLVGKLIAMHGDADEPENLNNLQGGELHTPIFIVGLHRSGTTLLEQLVDGHSQVRGVGELYDFTSQMRYATDHHCRGVIDAAIVEKSGNVDFSAVGRGYLEKMAWRLGEERYFTDKLPSNFLNIGFICRALPQAKILHMVRDPVETCFSNLRELFSEANPYSYDQLELADYYKQYRRLMAHWHQAWPGRILDVDYTELTRDPETVLRRVSEFCGLEFEPQMLALGERKRSVATASAIQVRQGIVAREQPKWAPYEAQLQPLIKALES